MYVNVYMTMLDSRFSRNRADVFEGNVSIALGLHQGRGNFLDYIESASRFGHAEKDDQSVNRGHSLRSIKDDVALLESS